MKEGSKLVKYVGIDLHKEVISLCVVSKDRTDNGAALQPVGGTT
jgi:hypothetical protein